MENNEVSPAASGKRRNASGVVLLSLSAYSAFSFILLLAVGRLIPTPLAEYIAFAYTYGKGGKAALSALFTVLYLAAAVLCAVLFREKNRRRLPVLIPAALLVFADFAVHAYAFLAAQGYQWIYLICAVLDGAMIFCLLYRPGKTKGQR